MLSKSQYMEFLQSKQKRALSCGFVVDSDSLNPVLFDWQRVIVAWALRKGRAALFEDCGLGKTFQQIEWAYQVCKHTSGDVLIVCPLAVAPQTKREAEKLGYRATVCRSQADCGSGISITNYEMLDHFDARKFAGVVLDESSILKAHDGKTRQQIIEMFSDVPYRLACTATPAPNDHMELGNHSEFLGVLPRHEMLATFFVHDGGETSKWRLKGHAKADFWRWMCSWSVMMRSPSDIGFSDNGYVLPPITRNAISVQSDVSIDGMLFAPTSLTLDERRALRRGSIHDRVARCAAIINDSPEQWLVWCDLNDESQMLTDAIQGAVQVRGSDSREWKEEAAMGFIDGRYRVLVSKPSIYGFGLNLQNCSNMAFVGLSDSFEQIYQTERRCWRFGQLRPVSVYVITSSLETAVIENIERKQRQFQEMIDGMVEHMRDTMQQEMTESVRSPTMYYADVVKSDAFESYLGDCVDVVGTLASESVDFTIFSPPFASLYTYSASDRDMGNSTNYEQFVEHFGFLIDQLYRVLRPGRIAAIHCMNLPTTKEKHGYIGIQDFRGDIIRAMQNRGFIYHSEVTIWKDPVTAMQRTKAIGLLYKQLRKDSTISRQGIPDYLVVFRKDGLNQCPVTKTHESFPVDLWQRYASPVWMDINPSDTLQKESARENEDERHIAPLQLEVIERAIRLWTNPGDLVLSPFMGIGSEGYVAIRNERRFIGSELKRSYWEQACRNLKIAEESGKRQYNIFDADSATA